MPLKAKESMRRPASRISEKHGAWTREIIILPAFDKRNPIPKKNYGWGGCDMIFVLRKKNKAATFRLLTNWHWDDCYYKVMEELSAKYPTSRPMTKPLPASIDYHSIKPHYKGQKPYGRCDFLGRKICYTDGSCLNATQFYDILVREGLDALWKAMEKWLK